MKTYLHIILFCLLICLHIAGSGQTLSLSSSTINASAQGETASLTVFTDTYCGIYDFDAWIQPETDWFYSTRSLQFHIGENPFSVPRTETFIVYNTTADYTYFSDLRVSVSQAANSWGIADTSLAIGAADGSVAYLQVTTEREWEIRSMSPWLTATIEQWRGATDIEFTAEQNPQHTTRYGFVCIALECADGSFIEGTVRLVQQRSVSGLSQSSLLFDPQQGSMQAVTLASDESWSVESLPEWLLASPTNGTGNGTLAFIAIANTQTAQRTDTVNVVFDSGKVCRIVAMQAGALPQFALTTSSKTFGADANSSIMVDVASNTNWGIAQMPEWIVGGNLFSSGDSSFSLTAQQNPFMVSRTADVLAYYMDADGTYENGSTIRFTQSASLSGVSDAALTIGATEGSAAVFSITTQSRWQITRTSDWLQVNNTSANGNADISVTASENVYTVQRKGFVDLRMQLSQSVWLTASVTVYQKAGTWGLSTSILTVGAEAASIPLSIAASSSWAVTGADGWAEVLPQASSGGQTVSVSISDNPFLYYRTDTLQFEYSNGKSSLLIIIQDPAQEQFEYDPAHIVLAADGSPLNLLVESNTGWGFASFPDWVITDDIYNYGDATIAISAQKNTDMLSRTDSVTVYWFDMNNICHYKTVAVSQRGNAGAVPLILNLQAGWNLISFNHVLDQNDFASVFGDGFSNILEIKSDSQFYRSDIPAVFSCLTGIEAGKGYWVKLQDPQKVYSSGIALKTDISAYQQALPKDWSLAGYPFAGSQTVTQLFADGKVQMVKSLDSFYDFVSQTGTLSELQPGRAYFVKRGE